MVETLLDIGTCTAEKKTENMMRERCKSNLEHEVNSTMIRQQVNVCGPKHDREVQLPGPRLCTIFIHASGAMTRILIKKTSERDRG